jgi:hypothetical protein
MIIFKKVIEKDNFINLNKCLALFSLKKIESERVSAFKIEKKDVEKYRFFCLISPYIRLYIKKYSGQSFYFSVEFNSARTRYTNISGDYFVQKESYL